MSQKNSSSSSLSAATKQQKQLQQQYLGNSIFAPTTHSWEKKKNFFLFYTLQPALYWGKNDSDLRKQQAEFRQNRSCLNQISTLRSIVQQSRECRMALICRRHMHLRILGSRLAYWLSLVTVTVRISSVYSGHSARLCRFWPHKVLHSSAIDPDLTATSLQSI